MLCTEDAIVRSEDVDDQLCISAPFSAVVEDKNGGELDLGKVILLYTFSSEVKRNAR